MHAHDITLLDRTNYSDSCSVSAWELRAVWGTDEHAELLPKSDNRKSGMTVGRVTVSSPATPPVLLEQLRHRPDHHVGAVGAALVAGPGQGAELVFEVGKWPPRRVRPVSKRRAMDSALPALLLVAETSFTGRS